MSIKYIKCLFKVFLFAILEITLVKSANLIQLQSDVPEAVNNSANNNLIYHNLFEDLLGIDPSKIEKKIETAWETLFYGNNETERIYYPVEPDMAYIEDINNNDIRTEGMSYGMMVAVQLNKKNEFDRLWKWAKTVMQHKTERRKYYFAWHVTPDGEILDSNSASDGEEWFVTSLFFASVRWGDGEGIYNYRKEAQLILDAMLDKVEKSDDPKDITNMFNKEEKQIVFVPAGEADDFTDPSYHLPHFYEIWAKMADKNNNFWRKAAETSRQFLKKSVNPVTGLSPDYASFEGKPVDPWGGGNNNFGFDAFRVASNVAVDYEWFGRDEWAIEQSNRLLNFFYSQGMNEYGCQYTLDGRKLNPEKTAALVSMNATAALAATIPQRKNFVQDLWDINIPAGKYRYYDGILYMLAILQVSGNFRIYLPESFNVNQN